MSVELAVTFLHETAAAICIYDHVSEEEVWIPLSQVDEIHGRRTDGGGEGTIVISDWIARQKGLTK